ncbi:heme oxygenase [Peribacillus frigoritolerans]|uniref:heme oxygenase n=1 Tax=Peribacillus frigoritolerans TaxID=450367 RepID=UPI000BFD4289|nr:heme oxygenase [Peribacillus frigoritolerans]MDG4847855.1 heme oxygenase [Peribacillus frigoritolerans]PHD77565.1 heme-degrading monooxygenase IsdG [Bacillus sp. AFS043905]TWD95855.1 heme oxygenase (staphylobilin-producing) [Peribacillus frigoritolerans]
MIIVTNKIRVKKGMGAVMAPGFTAPGPLDTMEGFVKVEVLLTQNLTDHDELSVNMYWENLDNFTAWRNSDAFKAAHKRPEPGSGEAKKESPILGSELTTYEVASVKEIAK